MRESLWKTPKIKKGFYVFGFALMAIVLHSCRKLDIDKQSQPPPNQEYAKRFFTVPASTDAAVVRVADYIRQRNNEKNFAEKLVRFDGYAQWDKTYVQVLDAASSNTIRTASVSSNAASLSGNGRDTIMYIPMVPQGANYVYSFIWAKLNGNNVEWRLFSGRDYDTHPNGSPKSDGITAEKIAVISMLLDNRTFGYTEFTVSDRKLFNSGGFSSDKPKHVKLTTKNTGSASMVPGGSVRINSTYMYVEYCYTYEYQSCPYDPCKGPGGSCDRCDKCMVSQTSCFEKMIALPSGGGGGGTVGSPPPPDGGGGPDGIPGNGDSPEDPCAINSPCGRQGWTADESLALNVAYDLSLTFAEKEWLEDHPERALDIRDYLTSSSASWTEKEDFSNQHVDDMIGDAPYLAFTEQYAGNYPWAEDMWWENSTFLAPQGGSTFGTWAMNYLIQNPSVPFATFKNQFLGKSEGVDGTYDQNYWEDPNLTFTPQTLPSWNSFSSAYPKHADTLYDSPGKMYNSVGGTVLSLYNSNPTSFGNTCALRVSKALNYSGITIPSGTDRYQGADGKYYFLSAKALLAWMKKTFGTPTGGNHLTGTQGGTNGVNFPSLLSGKKGIYIMVPNLPGGCANNTGFCASGHADMIDNSVCDGGCYFGATGGVSEIFIWELP